MSKLHCTKLFWSSSIPAYSIKLRNEENIESKMRCHSQPTSVFFVYIWIWIENLFIAFSGIALHWWVIKSPRLHSEIFRRFTKFLNNSRHIISILLGISLIKGNYSAIQNVNDYFILVVCNYTADIYIFLQSLKC